MGLFDKFKKAKPEQKPAEGKPKVFEDEFMDIQTGLISLCMELARENVDKVFAYCSIEDHSQMFNAFFEKKGRIISNNEIGANDELVFDFLRLGTSDLNGIKEACKKWNKPTPRQIKMTYDVNSGKYDADISYDSVNALEKSSGQVFMDWLNEEKEKRDEGIPHSCST